MYRDQSCKGRRKQPGLFSRKKVSFIFLSPRKIRGGMVWDRKQATSSTEAEVDGKSKVFLSEGLIFSENLEGKPFAESEVGNGKIVGLKKELRV